MDFTYLSSNHVLIGILYSHPECNDGSVTLRSRYSFIKQEEVRVQSTVTKARLIHNQGQCKGRGRRQTERISKRQAGLKGQAANSQKSINSPGSRRRPHTHTQSNTHTHTHTIEHTHTHTIEHTHTQSNTHTHTHNRTHTLTHSRTHTHKHTHTHTPSNTHTHTHTHSTTHTHTHSNARTHAHRQTDTHTHARAHTQTHTVRLI